MLPPKTLGLCPKLPPGPPIPQRNPPPPQRSPTVPKLPHPQGQNPFGGCRESMGSAGVRGGFPLDMGKPSEILLISKAFPENIVGTFPSPASSRTPPSHCPPGRPLVPGLHFLCQECFSTQSMGMREKLVITISITLQLLPSSTFAFQIPWGPFQEPSQSS